MKFLFLFIPLLFFGQTEPHLVNGKSIADAAIGKDFIYGCRIDITDFLNDNIPLIVYGYLKCEKDENIEYYKVFHENQVYLIKTSEVKISENDANYIKSIDSVQENILAEKIINLAKQKFDEIKSQVDAKVKLYKAKALQKGMLIKASKVVDQSEYTNGTGYEISFRNTSKKTIKYVWFSIKGINAVDDLVSTEIIKCIGPIEPNHEGTYSFDYVWYTDVVQTSKIPLVKIQYMDGSIKQIVSADDIRVNESLYNMIYEVEE